MDPDGNVYVAGITYGALDGNVNAGSNDIFVMKFDASSAHQWTVQRGSDQGDVPKDVEARPASRGTQEPVHVLKHALVGRSGLFQGVVLIKLQHPHGLSCRRMLCLSASGRWMRQATSSWLGTQLEG